jgi:hypothetical protein
MRGQQIVRGPEVRANACRTCFFPDTHVEYTIDLPGLEEFEETLFEGPDVHHGFEHPAKCLTVGQVPFRRLRGGSCDSN